MANRERVAIRVVVFLFATALAATDAVAFAEDMPPPRAIPVNIRPRPFPQRPPSKHSPDDNRAISRHSDGTITLGPVTPPGLVAPAFASEPPQSGVNVEEPAGLMTVEPQNFGALSVVSSPQLWPTSAAVKIIMHFPTSGWFVCSGSMIDPLHVLTAGHCVYDIDTNEWADDFLIYPAATDPTNTWVSPTAPFGGSGWTQAHSFTGWTSSGDFDYDIGVIDGDRTVGALSGWYGYGYNDSCSFFQTNTFRTPGYPAESPYDGSRMYTRSGTFDSCDYLLTWYGNEVRFNARSYQGQSGSSQVLSSSNVAYAVLSNGTASWTDSPRIISSEFASIQGFISADVPSSADVMPLWVRGSTAVAAGSALGSLTYYIHNYASVAVSRTYSVSVYLSTNDVISGSDRLIGVHNVSVNAASKGTVSVNVSSPPVIPADVAAGSYWIGVVIDANDAKTSNNDSSGQDALALTVNAGKPVVTIIASDSTAAEPSNQGQFTITRTGSTASSLSVSFSRSGTASNGNDYESISSPVSISAGAASTTLSVLPIDDATVEGNETVTLTLSSSTAYTIGSPSTATVTISDNDSAACFTLTTIGSPSNAGFASVNTPGNCNNATGYTSGTAISVTGTPFTSAYRFSHWTATNCTLANSNSPTTTCTVTGVGDPIVVANFSSTPCTSYSISPGSVISEADAGSQIVTVTGSPTGCQSAWNASGNGSWITVSPQHGIGSGSVTVSWEQNSGGPRAGSATIAGMSFVVNQSAAVSIRGLYLITPCRMIDTRAAADAPALAAGATRNIVAAGRCGVPPAAIALVANLTAVNPTTVGWMTLFPGPAGSTRPGVSTLNYRTGRTRANNALVGIAADGSLNVFNAGMEPVDFIIDVTGYFR